VPYKDPETQKQYCQRYYQNVSKTYYQRLKEEVLTHYGKGVLACVSCGEKQLPCLSIDHIDGGGRIQRHLTGVGSGVILYQWLKKNGYPLGYQTLCMNCQYLKRALNNENGSGRPKQSGH